MSALEAKMEEVMEICVQMGTPEWLELRDAIATYLEYRRRDYPTEMEARDVFLELGAPDHLVGHPYAVWALVLIHQDSHLLLNLSQELYPMVAETYKTTPSGVERGIRHLVDEIWIRGDEKVLQRYFGNTVSIHRGKPTNAEFLARLSNVIRQRLEAA